MCGIVGYVGDGLSPQLLGHLLDSMRHRGPDGEGCHHAGSLHMGMRRLSVIDLAHGWQPLRSRDKQVAAFQNGEIYNYRALRRELESAGFVFATASDTEVLAHGYDHWGIDGLLSRLDGMFALAIHDARRGELHLARDRMGEKPLFYSAAKDRFGYGSTLLAVASLPWVSGEIDRLALDRYLALHFVPGGRTLLADVRQLLPGERFRVSLDSLNIERERYYSLPLPPERRVPDNELAFALEAAVESRLVADVPVGVFLSGGLDSSVVAAIASRASPHLKTFSMGFSDDSVDESVHATAVARHVGAEHHCFRFDQAQFMTLLPEVAAALDTPIGDQALLPVYWLAREARKDVTVVLSGEGSDEVFAGYGYYRPFAGDARRGGLPGLLARLRSAPSAAMTPCAMLLSDDPAASASGFPLLTVSRERRQLLGEEAPQDEWEQGIVGWLNQAEDPLQRATAADLVSWLPDDLLVKFDRMTMAHSLEGRAPFLDNRLVELGLALRPEERMAQESKVALRRVARRYLPNEILSRPKQGFVLPMRRWLSEWFVAWNGPLSYFRQRPIPGLDQEALVATVTEDLDRGVSRERLLFALLMLAEWGHSFASRRAELSKFGVEAVGW